MASAKLHSASLILITGIPGVGKTTLVTKIHQALMREGVKCSGFVTEEVRVDGKRIGFDVVTVDGQRGKLSRVSDATSPSPGAKTKEYKVGQYLVNLMSFEQTALITLKPPTKTENEERQVYLIDEIGKMELFSQNFIQAVRKLLSMDVAVVATIPVPKGRPIPFLEELRKSPSKMFEVTRGNRDALLNEVMTALLESLKTGTSR